MDEIKRLEELLDNGKRIIGKYARASRKQGYYTNAYISIFSWIIVFLLIPLLLS